MTYIQILLNSFVTGCLLAMAAYGFSLIFRISRAFHLAQAGMYVAGAYTYVYFLEKTVPLTLPKHLFALTAGALLMCGLGCLIEKTIYYPLHARRGNEALTLIGSLGVNAILLNTIALFWGTEIRIVPEFWKTIPLDLTDTLILTNLHIVQVIVSLLLFAVIHLLFEQRGQLMFFKAVADNSDLAEISGVNVRSVRMQAMLIGSLFVLVSAVLRTHDVGVEPYSGMDITLSAAVIAILSVEIGVWKIFIVAIALALLQNLTEWFLSAQWREGLTFLLLLSVILWRTEGILSYQLRKDA